MPYRVGLTGGIGSGKSTVAAMFESRGVEVFDTDAIAHQLTAAGGTAMPKILEAFGPTFQNTDGSLNRRAMRQRVFSDADAKRKLEGILHPMIRQRLDEAVMASRSHYVLLAIPLLVESGHYSERVDRVLVVDCPEELQITRTMSRSRLTSTEAKAIVAAQCSRRERIRHANDIILNGDQLTPLGYAVAVLDQRYSRLATLSEKNATN